MRELLKIYGEQSNYAKAYPLLEEVKTLTKSNPALSIEYYKMKADY